jgi:hypothetical protein
MNRILALSALLVSTLAFAAPGPQSAQPGALLPQAFAGWTQTPAKDATPSPSTEEAAVMQEYGLAQRQSGSYGKDNSELMVRAWRFKDATGAYGAFTSIRQAGMHPETLGHEGGSAGDHFIFWNGATVIDASFAHPASDERSAMIALAAQIPSVGGAAGIPPTLPHYLPTAQLDASSVKYAIGPAGYARMGAQLPATAVDFGLDTEVVSAQYGPKGRLLLLLYPTPQIAGAHLKTIDAIAKASGFSTKRAGPLVAIVSGSASAQKAQQLLAAVHFDDFVTINHPEGYVPETVKLYRLLTGITMMVVILVCTALVLGIFFGGGRALVRMLRGKPASTVSEEEFISLHLG